MIKSNWKKQITNIFDFSKKRECITNELISENNLIPFIFQLSLDNYSKSTNNHYFLWKKFFKLKYIFLSKKDVRPLIFLKDAFDFLQEKKTYIINWNWQILNIFSLALE